MKSSGSQNFLGHLVILAFLAACSGMSPGGGAPTEVAQGGGGSTINNSLDSIGGDGPPGGGGDLPGGGGGSGQAAPGTQQTTDGIGAPCIISFKVSIKTLRNGAEESCVGTTARLNVNNAPTTTGEVEPPEPPALVPTVNMKFNFSVEDSPFNSEESQNTQCIEGRWRTPDGFFFRFPGKGLDCSNYKISAQANWFKNGKNFTSNAFQGPPVPDSPPDDSTIPLELTIELGSGVPHQVDLDDLPVLTL